MANPEHVAVVLRGRDAIQEWRSRHPNEPLDLRRAELWQKQLVGCDLSGALMEWTDLRRADLMECDLRGAQCERADFHKTDLAGAKLDGGVFVRAIFEDAKLKGASFVQSTFGGTRFLNCELLEPTGLESAIHQSNSILDDETLRISPNLPLVFLRGCGLFIPFQATVFRVILGGPADVEGDVARARDAVHEWNDHNAQERGQVLLPVWWKTHATPSLGDRPQAILNRQIVDRGDLLVAVFWSRLGTPTGVAESGTAEEIKRFMDAGKRVLAYFCKRPIPQTFNEDQWRGLKSFKEEIRNRGLVWEYSDAEELAKQLSRHLTSAVQEIRNRTI